MSTSSDVGEGVGGIDTIRPEPCAKILLLQSTPAPSKFVRRLRSVREHGLMYAVSRAVAHMRPSHAEPATGPRAKKVWPGRGDESLGLSAGDLVEVKSEDEVRATLDENGMYKGLYFMSEMWKYCGQTLVVLKPIERIYVEATGVLRSGIHNTVLLEDACCDGSSHQGCGANCFHLWREVWLRRPIPPA